MAFVAEFTNATSFHVKFLVYGVNILLYNTIIIYLQLIYFKLLVPHNIHIVYFEVYTFINCKYFSHINNLFN